VRRPTGPQKFTPQELRVSYLVKDGMTNRQIGASMGLTEGTIKRYMKRIFDKFGFNSRIELAKHMIETQNEATPPRPACEHATILRLGGTINEFWHWCQNCGAIRRGAYYGGGQPKMGEWVLPNHKSDPIVPGTPTPKVSPE
jgi:DNA-binding CsgD family transcriptional regulator